MPKILCRCDHVLDLILSPAPDGHRIVSEKMIYSLYGSKAESTDEIVSKINLQSVKMYKCPSCGRLIVFWDRHNNEPTFYDVEPAEESKDSK